MAYQDEQASTESSRRYNARMGLGIYTSWMQRKIVRDLVREHGMDVVHEPIPVSPRQPSLMYGVGAPVVIGPMNGGMNYPPDSPGQQGSFERWLTRGARRHLTRSTLLSLENARRQYCSLPMNERVRLFLEASREKS